MNRGLSIGLLVAGIVLLAWGISASGSFSSNVSETVTGAPANKTIWLIVAGSVLALGGLVGVFRPRSS